VGSPAGFLGARRADILERAEALLGFDTANPPGKTAEAVAYLTSELADLGVEIERVAADPAKPNLLARLPGRREETLLYVGHLDTVPYERSAWEHDPLGERVERGGETRLYGRGATDMKGALAAMVETARAYVETDTRPPVSLSFAFVSGEETGGDAGLSAAVDRLDADGCVVGETTCTERASVAVADRGSVRLTIEAEGVAAHGSRPWLGENAIDRLWDAVTAVRESVAGRSVEIDDAVRPVIEETVAYYEGRAGWDGVRERFERPSVNLGTVEGGTAVNVVPESATAEIDVRLPPGVDASVVLEELRTEVEACPGARAVDAAQSVGTFEALSEPVVGATVDIAESVLGERIYRRSATGGGDAKTLRNAGIPTVAFGVGTDAAGAPDEYTTVEALLANAQVYARLPHTFADRCNRLADRM
jgi:succinyl-diaminopimelate desuccinylase